MPATSRLRLWSVLPALALLGAACDLASLRSDAAADPPPKKELKKVQVAPNVTLEIQGDVRRVRLDATVCKDKGYLELLLTRKEMKEHEAVLTVDADARKIHQALLLAKAEPGSPVKFDPRYAPASGQPIKITVEWQEKDKTVSVNAKDMILNGKSKQTLNHDWVFAGSRLIKGPLDADKTIFLANDGDIVCVSNFETALLDLPIKSTKDNADLVWEANSEKIPPVGTKVLVLLELLPFKKK